jgi:hypothetical protein
MRVRVRYGHREIKQISRTATLGGLFLSFFKIGLVGFGGGLSEQIGLPEIASERQSHYVGTNIGIPSLL